MSITLERVDRELRYDVALPGSLIQEGEGAECRSGVACSPKESCSSMLFEAYTTEKRLAITHNFDVLPALC